MTCEKERLQFDSLKHGEKWLLFCSEDGIHFNYQLSSLSAQNPAIPVWQTLAELGLVLPEVSMMCKTTFQNYITYRVSRPVMDCLADNVMFSYYDKKVWPLILSSSWFIFYFFWERLEFITRAYTIHCLHSGKRMQKSVGPTKYAFS